MSQPVMIRTKNLEKHYGNLVAVGGLNLEVSAGKVFGFLGPNGAGKTTTIKMLVGMMQPTSGSIEINGVDLVKDHIEAKRQVGFIPDRPYIYEKLTGMEFLHFIGGLFRMDDGDIESRGRNLLRLFEIDHVADELVAGYSHGMRQRLIMASALLHRPKVIVVDEPMVGLDPRGAKLVKKIFRQQADAGTAVFMSTHTLAVAEEICDHIAIINKGKIIAEGSVDELKKQTGLMSRLEETFLRLTNQEEEQDITSILSE